MPDRTRFLFVSYDALITDIAWQVVKEGHDVKYWIREKKAKSIGDGFVPKTDDWKAEVDWADVIVFDDVLGMGEEAERLRKKGKHVVGGTAYTDVVDVCDEASVAGLAERCHERHEGVDILLNAAGVIVPRPSVEVSLEEWKFHIDTNLTGTFLGCREFGRRMIEQGSGSIINTSSRTKLANSLLATLLKARFRSRRNARGRSFRISNLANEV